MRRARLGLARMQVVLVVIVLVVAAVVGAYALTSQGSGSTNTLHLSITETDPVNQVDNFVPQNLTVKMGSPVTISVQNGDDELRVFTIAAFNFNMSITANTSNTGTFTPTQTGTFKMYSPQTPPSAASNGKPGTPCTGWLTVTA